MTYIELGGAVALGGLILAALNALHARLRDRWADGSAHAASDGERDANIRALNVQMSMQTDMMREMRDTTRDMSRQIGNHTEQMARHDATLVSHGAQIDRQGGQIAEVSEQGARNAAQLGEHERRISAIERRCDIRHSPGGTD